MLQRRLVFALRGLQRPRRDLAFTAKLELELQHCRLQLLVVPLLLLLLQSVLALCRLDQQHLDVVHLCLLGLHGLARAIELVVALQRVMSKLFVAGVQLAKLPIKRLVPRLGVAKRACGVRELSCQNL
ncbi:hypothetical protein ATCC90586_011909 [Pythium insidiosum]|nr:hypothetical protein ATCC90586_011909 [Pythium insidiosum]